MSVHLDVDVAGGVVVLVDDGHHLHVRRVDAAPPHGGLQKFSCKKIRMAHTDL